MDDFQFISTFSILIDEMLEEGNYEVMANGVFVEFTVNGTFITRTELCNIRDCKNISRTTRDKVRAVLDALEEQAKEEEGGEA